MDKGFFSLLSFNENILSTAVCEYGSTPIP